MKKLSIACLMAFSVFFLFSCGSKKTDETATTENTTTESAASDVSFEGSYKNSTQEQLGKPSEDSQDRINEVGRTITISKDGTAQVSDINGMDIKNFFCKWTKKGDNKIELMYDYAEEYNEADPNAAPKQIKGEAKLVATMTKLPDGSMEVYTEETKKTEVYKVEVY